MERAALLWKGWVRKKTNIFIKIIRIHSFYSICSLKQSKTTYMSMESFPKKKAIVGLLKICELGV